MSLLAAADTLSPKDQAQNEFDRFVDLIADGMWANGADSGISAKPDASDEMLIAAAVQQLNNNPGPIKEWHILKKELVGPHEFEARLRKMHPELYPPGISPGSNSPSYLVAVIDSDQGHKIIAINETWHYPNKGDHWARIYNCDAVFTSPMNGFQGTPLIR